jgi:hypothetical protein
MLLERYLLLAIATKIQMQRKKYFSGGMLMPRSLQAKALGAQRTVRVDGSESAHACACMRRQCLKSDCVSWLLHCV